MSSRVGESLSLISHSHIVLHPLTGPLVSIPGITVNTLHGTLTPFRLHTFGPDPHASPAVGILSSSTFSLFTHCGHCLMARVLIPTMYIDLDMNMLAWISRESLMHEYHNLSFSLQVKEGSALAGS